MRQLRKPEPRLADTPSRGTQPGNSRCAGTGQGNINAYIIMHNHIHRYTHIDERINQRTQTTPRTPTGTGPLTFSNNVPRQERRERQERGALPPGRGVCYCVTVLLCYCVTALLCDCVTVLLCYCVTVLLCYCVTVLLCYCVTVLLC